MFDVFSSQGDQDAVIMQEIVPALLKLMEQGGPDVGREVSFRPYNFATGDHLLPRQAPIVPSDLGVTVEESGLGCLPQEMWHMSMGGSRTGLSQKKHCPQK